MRAQDWPTTTLGRVVDFFAGGSLPEGQPYVGQDGGYFLMKVSDMNLPGNETAILRSKEWSESPGARSATCPSGAVVIPKRGGAIGTNKKRLTTRPAVLDPNLMAVWPHRDQVDLKFLYQWFLAFDLTSVASGSSVPQLNKRDLAPLSFPLPPIQEQRRIAEVLDRADELRAKRRESLAHLDNLTQSIFLEMFGNHRTILTDWPTTTLGGLLDFLTSGSRGWAAHYADHGDLFLRIQNVRGGELVLEDVAYVEAPDSAEARRTRVQPGDVLLSITADLGRTAVIPNDLGVAFINQHLSIIRCSKLDPDYLSAYLSSPAGQDQILRRNRQGVKAGLNFDDVRAIIVPCPPRTLQLEYAERVKAVRRLRRRLRASVAELDALFAALQSRAFRRLS